MLTCCNLITRLLWNIPQLLNKYGHKYDCKSREVFYCLLCKLNYYPWNPDVRTVFNWIVVSVVKVTECTKWNTKHSKNRLEPEAERFIVISSEYNEHCCNRNTTAAAPFLTLELQKDVTIENVCRQGLAKINCSVWSFTGKQRLRKMNVSK